MIIIEGLFSKSAIDWSSIESISFDDRSEAPDAQLKIVTKSGASISIVNPTLIENGNRVSFDDAAQAWFDNVTGWRIKENYPEYGIPQSPPMQIPQNIALKYCNDCGKEEYSATLTNTTTDLCECLPL